MVRLLLVEANKALREALKETLQRAPDIELLAEVGSAEKALSWIRVLTPDVLLIDIHLLDGNALSAARRIKLINPRVKIILLTEGDTTLYAEAAAQSGVSACLGKTAMSHQLLSTLRAVQRGEELGVGKEAKL